jgi:predicted nucleic acid-binding protein
MVHEACDEAASLIARYFLDSSALVKRYHRESGSPDVDQLLAAPDNQIIISRLALVELHSSFARLVREKVLSESDINKVVSRLEADVASGLLNVVAVSSSRLEAASLLLRKVGLSSPLRTLDAIHLATAQAVHGRSRIADFVAADKKLLTAAAAAGFTVRNVG